MLMKSKHEIKGNCAIATPRLLFKIDNKQLNYLFK